MKPLNPVNYDALDRPEVVNAIFHPRPELGIGPVGESTKDHSITVDQDVHIGAQFHIATKDGPNILFFHGNGEIVADYEDIAPVYLQMSANFLVVDYRGYGRSNGSPSVSAMMADAHKIFHYVRAWLRENGYTGPFLIMGRSLGSASALELAAHYADEIDGLIIESGFAYAEPLLRLLGVDTHRIGFQEADGFGNIDKIARYCGPTLIIHAQYDHIIPFSDGQALFEASRSGKKTLLQIDGANHNDIFFRGLELYMISIQNLITTITAT